MTLLYIDDDFVDTVPLTAEALRRATAAGNIGSIFHSPATLPSRHQDRCNGSCESAAGCDCIHQLRGSTLAPAGCDNQGRIETRRWGSTGYGSEDIEPLQDTRVIPLSEPGRWALAWRRFWRG